MPTLPGTPLLFLTHLYKEYFQNRRGVPGSRGPWGGREVLACASSPTLLQDLRRKLGLPEVEGETSDTGSSPRSSKTIS